MNGRTLRLNTWLVALALAVCAVAQTGWAKNPKNEVYVIGDSLSDTGNLFALTGYFPPPPYAQRFSNGPVWAEYFADEFEVRLDSRAYGGALTGEVTYGGSQYTNYDSIAYGSYPFFLSPTLPGVQQEVAELLEDHPKGLNRDALYVIWAGANDFFFALDYDYNNFGPIMSSAVMNIAEAVCSLNAAGAKHFAVINLPDLGLTPLGTSLGEQNATMLSYLMDQFNQALAQSLLALRGQCANTLVILDSYQYLQDMVSNPQKYGFVDVTTPCIALGQGADCSQHVFWDTVHPTTAAHEVLADLIRADFCGTGDDHPGLRGRPSVKPPPIWRGVCYGSR